jgi:hypothetical protein
MTDQPRKLPVITAIIYTDDTGRHSVLGAAVDEPEVSGIIRASAAPIASGCAVVSLFDPAVPRCKTCDSYTSCHVWTMNNPSHSRCSHPNGPRVIPSDGSGYCYLHSEAKR